MKVETANKENIFGFEDPYSQQLSQDGGRVKF
jgi:hypothetical protein